VLKGCKTSAKAILAKPQKYESGGRLKVKIHILFYGENSLTVTPR
jgi:hypothetical protein